MARNYQTYYLVKMNFSQNESGWELYSRTADLIIANLHASECMEKYPKLTGLVITKETEKLENRII